MTLSHVISHRRDFGKSPDARVHQRVEAAKPGRRSAINRSTAARSRTSAAAPAPDRARSPTAPPRRHQPPVIAARDHHAPALIQNRRGNCTADAARAPVTMAVRICSLRISPRRTRSKHLRVLCALRRELHSRRILARILERPRLRRPSSARAVAAGSRSTSRAGRRCRTARST